MRKCRVPSTFNLDVAKMLIGTTIPGTVVRVGSPESTSKGWILYIFLGFKFAFLEIRN
jgi:hypothetical protein